MELGGGEDVEAAILPFGDHYTPRKLVPELGRKDQTALFVQARSVGAEKHRPNPLALSGVRGAADPLGRWALPASPLRPTLLHFPPPATRIAAPARRRPG
ncbi:hypothetical protein TPA0907_09870 [Micromonospora humidisoli]|nr:hypothetical protein TPA0907_09870 [Micromonospora sp. AKA109]